MAYVVLESSVRTHRKMLAAGPAACWLWVCGNGYCQEGLTDGHIPESALLFLGVPAVDAPALAEVLVRERLWDRADGGWQVHDYHAHNKSADEVRRIMRARQDGGKLGGRPPKTSKVTEDRNLPRNPSGTTGTDLPFLPTVHVDRSEPSRDDSNPAAGVVLVFPTVGRGPKTWPLTAAYVAELAGDYPGLDVMAECRKARAWCVANEPRRKTAKGMPAFLVSWFNKAVRDGGPRLAVVARQPEKPEVDWFEECKTIHNGECGLDRHRHAHRVAMDADAASQRASA